MGRVSYVNAWPGGPACRLRFWLCRLGGCAGRFRESLGQGGWGFPCLSAPAVPELTFRRSFVWAYRHCRCWHAVAPCRCLVGWCGAFRGVRRVGWVSPLGGVPCFGVVVRCGAPCCVVMSFAVLDRAGPCCVAVRRAVWCRVAPCRAVVCRAVPHRAASCCGLWCLGVLCCGALHSGALRCGVPCCLVLCRRGSVVVSPARVLVRSACRSVAGWWLGAAVRCEVARWARAVGVGVCRSGRRVRLVSAGLPSLGACACALWGFLPLASRAVAALSSSSGACEVALAVAGVVAWR